MSKLLKFEYYHQHQRNILFNDNWFFSLDDQSENKYPFIEAENFTEISLPHDWSIEFDFDKSSPAQNEAGLLNGGIGWYRKQFIIGEELSNSSIILRFGAIYMDSKVYVNGLFVGNVPNGYIPFSFDISKYAYCDGRINTIAIKVTNQQPSSRWYSGSGIYRDVHLNILNSCHFIHDSIVINYEDYKDCIKTKVTYKISNASEDCHINLKVQKKDGSLVFENYYKSNNLISFDLFDIDLWSCENPNLYILYLDLYQKGKLIDSISVQYGYRFIHWDSEKGFFLNDKNIKLKGVCLHHDNGALGAVASYDAIYRKLSIMKEMGANAIRSSHNPCDDKTIKVAEEIGLMVIDEAFDTWFKGKKKYDYGQYFNEISTHPHAKNGESWAEFDIKAMVRRGINSPAIIMWSLGNEINESNDASPQALDTVKNLNRWVKELDTTRYTTMGQDVYRWAETGVHEKISNVVDAVGLNYAESSFKTIRKNHPDWLIYGSETSSGTRSRGEYAYPDKICIHDNSITRNFQQSDYGNDHVSWGNSVEYCIKFDNINRDYAGQFYWTGFDYIGEPTPWHNQNNTPAKSSYFGLVDTCGFPKNDYFLLQSQWSKKPIIHLYPHWNWNDVPDLMTTKDNKIPVRVASNQHYVEVLVNGISLGTKGISDAVYREWRISFTKGTITAIGYDSKMNQTCITQVSTSKSAYKNKIEKDRFSGERLDYLIISAVDEDEIFNPLAQHELFFELKGQAQIIGVDNGNPSSLERYKSYLNNTWKRKLFNGMALVIVQKNHPNSKYKLSVTSPLLEEQVYVSHHNCDLEKGTTSDSLTYYHQNENTDKSLKIKKIHKYPLFMKKDQKPKQTYDILIQFDNNSMNWYPFVLLTDINTSKANIGKATAYLKNFDLEFEIEYHVEHIVAVENLVYTTLNTNYIDLPSRIKVYNSDKSTTMCAVEWIRNSQTNYYGKLNETPLLSHVVIRETEERVDGTNFSQIWTGSKLPLAFSLKLSNRSISRINNGDYTTSNPYYLDHSIGIIFGDSGDFSPQYIDNIVIQTDSFYVDQNISIFYCDDTINNLPSDENQASHLNDYTWKTFKYITKSYDQNKHQIRLCFSGIKATAILINGEKFNIYQVSTYKALPVTLKPEFTITNGLDRLNSNCILESTYQHQGSITVSCEKNCTYTILDYQDETKVLIIAENKDDSLTFTFYK